MSTLQNTHDERAKRRSPSAGPLTDAMRQLDRLGQRARLLLLSRRAFRIVAAAVGVAACMMLVDWLFRFPAALRVVFLAGGLVSLVLAGLRLLVPAWKFRPTPTTLALRIERSSPALRGRLASGVEFAMSDAGRESPLAARSMADLAERLGGESILSWLAPRRSLAEVSMSAAAVAIIALLAVLMPTYAAIGAQRLLWPFSRVEWPARTAVESLMGGTTHHAKGRPLLLTARLTQGDAKGERIAADVRSTRDNGSVTTDTLVLTRQADGRYERVLEGDVATRRVEIRFRSADAETPTQAVDFVEPPLVLESRLTLEPPGYAQDVVEPRSADLGPGTDERATLREPALIGAKATLEVTLNAPLKADATTARATMIRLLEREEVVADAVPELVIDSANAAQWTLSWTVTGATALQLALTDEHGITAADEIVFRIDAVGDRSPTCAVLTPAADESVLPTAIVPVQIEGRDDVGLSAFGLIVTRREDGASEAQPFGDTVAPAAGTLERRDEPLDLAVLAVRPGDVLTLVAAAEDMYEIDGQRHERVLSAPRTVRIISETDLGKQIRTQLSALRRAAIRFDEQQGELLAATQNGRFDPALERTQAQLSERIRNATETVTELRARVDRNRLADDELTATLDQAKDLLDMAARASARASEAMQQRREAASKPEAERAAAQENSAIDAEKAQEDVRAELEDLVKLLDRDEDSWAMGRAIDRLREQVDELARRTEQTGKSTVGQQPEELSQEDREALQAIADGQRDSALEAQELLDELRKRAEALARSDRTRAEAMRQAAKSGEERRLQKNLEQAGMDAKANRIEQARGAQQQAQAALDEMRQGLDDVRKAKAEELRRALESLEQSIERLVTINENELIALARVTGPGEVEPIADLARAMAKLAQNTQAVASEARAAGSEANSVARILDRAADSHGGAVGSLRATPVKLAEATTSEERGLELLKSALEQTKTTREQVERREAERKKGEILAVYRRVLDRQAGAIAGVSAARPADLTARLDRRALIESKRLSIVQGEIGRELAQMLADFEDLRQSVAFLQAHELIAGWASDASTRLAQGDLSDATVAGQQQILETVSQLIEALNEQQPDDQQFASDADPNAGGAQQAGGGEGPPPPTIPPVAELKLLRGMQQMLLDRTRKLDGVRQMDPSLAGAVDAELKALGEMQQRVLDAAVEVVKKLDRPAQEAPDPESQDPESPDPEEPAPAETSPQE
ncbi:MAG: hypothetical protein SGJ11_13795 [Phycisphaerae bacterium]|nr:hypothetical protein [Phycisphaerae bacterium]